MIQDKTEQTLVIYGDSISTTSHGQGGYETLLLKALEVDKIFNKAISGSGLSLDTPNSLAALLTNFPEQNLYPQADRIILWHGTNDWYWGAEIGSLASRNCRSYLGALHFSLSLIKQASPEARILCPTPIWRYQRAFSASTEGEAWQTKNRRGLRLEDYVKALEEAALVWDFSVFDIRRLCGFDQPGCEKFLEDRIHPNQSGYKILAPALAQAVTQL